MLTVDYFQGSSWDRPLEDYFVLVYTILLLIMFQVYYSIVYLIWLILRYEVNVMQCVCVFFPSILDIKFVGRTSRGHTGGRSHRIFNPPSFCGACLDFCREKDSAIPFPRRP